MNDDNELTLDEVFTDFDQPKQYYEPPNFDDVKKPNDEQARIENEIRAEEISQETAEAAGRNIADLVTNGVTTVCSFVGKEPAKKYEISAGQKRDLEKSYSEVAKHYNIQGTNPLFNAIFLTIVIFSVPVKTAFQDRKIKQLEEKQKQQEMELKELSLRQAMLEKQMREKAAREEILEDTIEMVNDHIKHVNPETQINDGNKE